MFDLKEIRKELHQEPELSRNEKKTSEKIVNFLKRVNPDSIVTDLGGFGVIAVFDTGKSGPSVLFRAELDGLPIDEENDFSYKSCKSGVSHSCGHDGHMSILLGLAEKINRNKNDLCGKFYLLFQPAEEIAFGANKVLESSFFESVDIDFVFALHNLPGFEKGCVVLRKDVFAASSKGLVVRLKGRSSHAGHPENGVNPVFAMMDIVRGLMDISDEVKSSVDRSLITIIHLELGEVAFGTSPGDGVVMATFRSTDSDKMKFMSDKGISLVEKTAGSHGLDYVIEWVEVFPLLVNDDSCVDLVEKAAVKNGFDIVFVDEAFSWTEDFSYFTNKYRGCFFGLGSGIDHPQLHNSDFDFPDDLLDVGVDMFYGVILEIMENKGC